MDQHSVNFLFWKMAFERKQTDIYILAKMTGNNGEITKDEFQEITGLEFLPDIKGDKINFISTSDIMQELAISKISSMKKDNIISQITGDIAKTKVDNMKKDVVINGLTAQMANIKLELIKTRKAGN